MTNQMQMVALDLIDPHPLNPRRDLGDLTELADSIKAQGIRQNLLLVPQHDQRDHSRTGRYTAVIGHRRRAAAELAGLDQVPAVVDDELDEAGQIELMLLENIQRNDLSPVEEAQGYQQLLDLGVKVRQIAATTGRSEKTVTARLRLMKLSEAAREKVHTHQATLEDAAQLDALVGHPAAMKKAARALGTSNFRWVIEECRRDVRVEAVKKEIRAELKKAGIPHHTSDGYAYNDFRPAATLARVADLTKAVKAGLPDGTVWIDNYSGIALIRPTTEDERAGTDAESSERERRREFDDRIAEEGVQAFKLRDEFIRGLLSRKRLPAKDTLAILASATPFVLTSSAGHLTYELGRWLGSKGYADGAQMRQLMVEKFPDAEPACWLLLHLHLGAQNSYGWHSAGTHEPTRALYGLLNELGYQMSDVEAARVFPPADDSEDDGEDD